MVLTKSDWKQFEKLLDKKFDTKLAPIKEQIAHLPTKEEFYAKMDRWIKAANTTDIEKPLHKRDHEEIRKFLVHAR